MHFTKIVFSISHFIFVDGIRVSKYHDHFPYQTWNMKHHSCLDLSLKFTSSSVYRFWKSLYDHICLCQKRLNCICKQILSIFPQSCLTSSQPSKCVGTYWPCLSQSRSRITHLRQDVGGCTCVHQSSAPPLPSSSPILGEPYVWPRRELEIQEITWNL